MSNENIDNIIIKKGNFPVLNIDSSLYDAIFLMNKHKLGTACVVNENGELLGIFTDGDLRRTLQKYTELKNIKIKDVMTKNPLTIYSDILAAEALNILETNEITSLLVTTKTNQLSGIITLNAILRAGID